LQVIGRLVVGFAVSLSAIGECIYISEIAPAVSKSLYVDYQSVIFIPHMLVPGGPT
jgi:hypothetical protein